jgi:hypothetical protein
MWQGYQTIFYDFVMGPRIYVLSETIPRDGGDSKWVFLSLNGWKEISGYLERSGSHRPTLRPFFWDWEIRIRRSNPLCVRRCSQTLPDLTAFPSGVISSSRTPVTHLRGRSPTEFECCNLPQFPFSEQLSPYRNGMLLLRSKPYLNTAGGTPTA